jgi:hypothetical protein
LKKSETKFPIPIRISSGQGLYDAISVQPKTKTKTNKTKIKTNKTKTNKTKIKTNKTKTKTNKTKIFYSCFIFHF